MAKKGFLNPSQALNELDLTSEMIAVDFGSGSGGWTLPLAKKLENGKVFAIDVLEESLSVLKGRIESEDISNVQAICSDVEREGGSKIGNNTADLVLIANLLFQSENKKAVFEEAKRVLKKGGKALVVDWMPRFSLGPEKGRISSAVAKKTARESGFRFERQFKAGTYHFGLVFERA